MDNTKQDIIGYFDILQQEYFQNEIRRKIYPNASDKAYYEAVMERKAVKIKDIAAKNSFLSIFNSEIKRNEYITLVYKPKGLPYFGKSQSNKDVNHYFASGSLVKVYSSEGDDIQNYKLGNIRFHNVTTASVEVILKDGNVVERSRTLVTRVL